MLTHEQIWQSIDRLAREHGYSPSGLAKKAGLDPTTFNKSKRVSTDGKPRWPSTESIAKILGVTGASMGEFLSLGEDEQDVMLRQGDSVAVMCRDGRLITGTLKKLGNESIQIQTTAPRIEEQSLKRADIEWVAHIVLSL